MVVGGQAAAVRSKGARGLRRGVSFLPGWPRVAGVAAAVHRRPAGGTVISVRRQAIRVPCGTQGGETYRRKTGARTVAIPHDTPVCRRPSQCQHPPPSKGVYLLLLESGLVVAVTEHLSLPQPFFLASARSPFGLVSVTGTELVRPCLVRKNFQNSPSHRIFSRMHGTLNIDEIKN